jgi:hypothetical protein
MTQRVIPIKDARSITGGLTQTSKMPCKSYSLPTLACQTGYRMAQIPGSVCASCYANKGFYKVYAKTIEPAQVARLASLDDPLWVDSMVAQIGTDPYFRWHDSGDLQSVAHLEMIAAVCRATPGTRHWLPTREYGMVKDYIAKHGREGIPSNLVVRLSAMYPDRPVIVPASLRGIAGIAISSVHDKGQPIGTECQAPARLGNR